MRARPGAFSFGRLIDLLTVLGKDVEIAIRDKPTEARAVRIRAAAAA
jgi:hypothetical protein